MVLLDTETLSASGSPNHIFCIGPNPATLSGRVFSDDTSCSLAPSWDLPWTMGLTVWIDPTVAAAAMMVSISPLPLFDGCCICMGTAIEGICDLPAEKFRPLLSDAKSNSVPIQTNLSLFWPYLNVHICRDAKVSMYLN